MKTTNHPNPPLPRGLYLITDENVMREERGLDLLDEILELGVEIVQWRAKHLPDDEYLEIGHAIRQITQKYGALLIVNDRVHLVKELDADGVHVGQSDAPPSEVGGQLPPGKLIGLSTHNREQVLAAAHLDADYLGFGPVFTTSTKENPDPVAGTEELAWAVANARQPVVAIGGITLDNLDGVLRAGARHIAVVSAIWSAKDPVKAAEKFINRIEEFGANGPS